MAEQNFSLDRFDTPIGPMLIVCDDAQRVRALEWEDHAPRLKKLLRRYYGADATMLPETKRAAPVRRALQAYFAGDLDAVAAVTVATNGTDFQRLVWDALRRIPAGETVSYSALATRIGRPTASRAVGLANGANPIPIVVPCHRVIGADASLTGFGSGLPRKRWLLEHERRHCA